MNFPFYIAKRYLFSKKSQNVINIISSISVVGVSVGVLALVVVMSAFNGLEDLIGSLYSTFDPDLRITIKEGKTFDASRLPIEKMRTLNGVASYSKTLEETVYIQYKGHETVATIKGVDNEFIQLSGLDSMIVEGELLLEKDDYSYAVLGYGVAYNLNVFIEHVHEPLKIYTAKRGKKITSLNPQDAFNKKGILPSGIFAINQDFDMKYVLVPFAFAAELLEYENEVTAIEINVREGIKAEKVKEEIQELLGDAYEVKTRYELNALIFKTNQTEKWITFLILSFILVIATFNVIGSLTMLIIDKTKDINILKSLGADRPTIRTIFLFEGLMITLLGGVLGIVLGTLLCWAQQRFGLVRLEGVIVDYYPVSIQITDLVAVLVTVICIGLFASWFPVNYVTRKHFA